MNAPAILAWLDAQADIGVKAAAILTEYYAGSLSNEQLRQKWTSMRIERAQAERLWNAANDSPGPGEV